MQRPNLNKVDISVRLYIEYLEAKLGISPSQPLSPADFQSSEDQKLLGESYPAEPETDIGILTISSQGWVKRTLRHIYHRQHRGGMGVFDLDVTPQDYPTLLGMSSENQTMLLFTNLGRAFRFNFQSIEPTPIRSKGSLPFERLPFEPLETLVAILPEQAKGYIAFLSESGKVRCLRHHFFGEHMRPGTMVYNYAEFGPLAAACWTSGDSDLFITSKSGLGIRFDEKKISPQGELGIRLSGTDTAVGITSVNDESEVFILSSDGKGTIRQMSGFAPNKSPGGSGKIAMKNNSILGVSSIQSKDDIFIITHQGKIIRFQADEIPSSDGAVQGVNSILLRLDEVTAFLVCQIQPN